MQSRQKTTEGRETGHTGQGAEAAQLGPEDKQVVAERGRDDREVLRRHVLVQLAPGVSLVLERHGRDLAHLGLRVPIPLEERGRLGTCRDRGADALAPRPCEPAGLADC